MDITSDTTQGVTSDASIQQQNWRESLPEQLRDAPYFKNAESLEKARQEIDNAAYWQGNSILKPTENASDEQKAANLQKIRDLYPQFMPVPDPHAENFGDVQSEIFTKLGRPDAADKYKMPEGFDVDPEEAGLLKALALDANMTQAQFEKYQQGVLGKRYEIAEQRKAQRDEGIAALRNELGVTFEPTMQQINTMLEVEKGIPQQIKEAHKSGTLDAEMYRWLADIASRGDELPVMPGKPDTAVGMTPEQAKQEAADIRERFFKMDQLDPMRPVMLKKLTEMEFYAQGRVPPQ